MLEDDDVLEMVNAGLAPITIVDDYLAEFWSKVFTGIKVHKRHHGAVRRQPGRRVSQRESQAPRGRQHVAPEARQGRRLPKHHRTPLSRQRQVREKRRGRCRAPEAAGRGRAVQEVRGAVRRRLPADGGAGVPGIDAGSGRQEPRGRDWRDAGHAPNREGAERRRHHRGRVQHPRRREVHAVHDGPVLQGRSHGPAEQRL